MFSSHRETFVNVMGPTAMLAHSFTAYTSSVASAQLKLRPCLGQLSLVSTPLARLRDTVSNVSGAVRLNNPNQLSPGETSPR
jgi:hypothetical protein